MKKQRLFYLDLIRAVALVCILVIHFNAAVTGYFTLPSKLFGSVLPFNIYLGGSAAVTAELLVLFGVLFMPCTDCIADGVC